MERSEKDSSIKEITLYRFDLNLKEIHVICAGLVILNPYLSNDIEGFDKALDTVNNDHASGRFTQNDFRSLRKKIINFKDVIKKEIQNGRN